MQRASMEEKGPPWPRGSDLTARCWIQVIGGFISLYVGPLGAEAVMSVARGDFPMFFFSFFFFSEARDRVAYVPRVLGSAVVSS